jgi:hypothetical protein
VGTGSALAFQALPPGQLVNNDPTAGIDPTQSVSGGDPTNADVVGGALTAGKPGVPWAIFQQGEASPAKDQVFVRSFANGAWTTRGNGTVGGLFDTNPTFKGSLNFDQNVDGEVPSIDFAGAGRTVPWATWYEDTTAFAGNGNVFASRFDNTGDANQGKWIFGGQSRGTGTGTVNVPSLNIHTNQDAENPSVAGGSAVDPTKPGPWVAWQETDTAPTSGVDQIFVSRPEGPGMANCDGVTPAGVVDRTTGHVPAIGGFCFQQTGIGRVGAGAADPSLNVDPTRNGIEPDIAFTGANDSVPWVVWYETGNTTLTGLHNNEMVFAAKGIANGSAEGGFQWVAVGNVLQETLDATGTHKFGQCAESATNEEGCSLNSSVNANAEDPQVAAGAMNPANPTAPWVTWDEVVNGVNQVFVSRLVGGPTGHFQIVNGGAPVSTATGPGATRPDITFSGNTPYVSWRQDIGGGVVMGFYGHFVNAANPTFVLDESDVPLTPTAQADVREPISSSCIATPFNGDGSACQGGALGTPFFLFTNGTPTRSLFAGAYQPDNLATNPATGVSTSGGTLNGSVNPEGASVSVFFQFGPTTSYGQTTPAEPTGVTNVVTPFSAVLSGLTAGSVVHYRAVAATDFGTLLGNDQTLTVASPPPPPPGTTGTTAIKKVKVSGKKVTINASCAGTTGQSCQLTFTMTVVVKFRGRKIIGVTAKTAKVHHKPYKVGSTRVTLQAGQSQTVTVSLNGKGRFLLSLRHHLKVRLKGTQALANNQTVTVLNKVVTFHSPPKKHHG